MWNYKYHHNRAASSHHSRDNHYNFIAMAGSSFMNIIPLCVFLLTVLISVNSSKAVTNYLPTGKTLESEAELSYTTSDASLLMRFDCYLVLYNRFGKLIWQSTVPVIGVRNCSLTFTDNGQLAVRNDHGGPVWTSPNIGGPVGKYVAVLHPEGKLSIYGPSWRFLVGELKESTSNINNNNNVIVSSMMNTLKNAPPVYNMLFSGQVLYNGGKLSDNGYSLVIEDCELVLKKGQGNHAAILWTSNTKREGKYCFLRLNHNGVLIIFDDHGRIVWSTERLLGAPTGQYVLVLHQNGYPVIYEPEVWFAPNPKNGLIEMPIAEIQ